VAADGQDTGGDPEVAKLSRESFRHRLLIPTRWNDNDVYGHVNNVEYYSFFDTVINRWLIEEGGLDIHDGTVIGLCAESHCRFRAGLSFPDRIEAWLRVGHLGGSSVRYELALFREGEEEAAATGWFVHVFVDRESRRPAAMPAELREALERLAPTEPGR
jgi:acyl-CoA thioester hydrolase